MSPIDTPTNARSRRTRSALLSAARALLEEGGAEALTMVSVAERAGVTRRTVYLHFGVRAELLGGLFEHVAEEEGLQDSLARVWAAPDGSAALDEWARHLARYHTRVLAIDRAIQRDWRTDEDAARHRRRAMGAKLASCRRLARRLDEDGRLAGPWPVASAADMLFALSSSDVVEGLTADRGWSQQKLATHLGRLLRSSFLAPSPEPEARP